MPTRWTRCTTTQPHGEAARTGRNACSATTGTGARLPPERVLEKNRNQCSITAGLRKWGLQPWRVETFKFSTDPELEAKVRDVVALYLNPPDKAIVLCIDEKSQIQALDRTAPILPLRPGLPAKQTHDYKRNGTTTLFAALEVATGLVTQACYDQHRHEEFLRFLKLVARTYPRRKLHIVCDNYGTHKHPVVRALARAEPADHAPLHANVRVMAEHGRDLLRDHHPSGNLPGHQGPHRRHHQVHRRMERPVPSIRVDQNRRPNPHPQQKS